MLSVDGRWRGGLLHKTETQKERVSKRYHRNQSSPHENKGKQRVVTMTRSQPPRTPSPHKFVNTIMQFKSSLVYTLL